MMATAKRKTDEAVAAVIEPANILETTLHIAGTTPFVQAKFSADARAAMMTAMTTSKAERKAKSARPPRDYDKEFRGAQHRSVEGWVGIPCGAFRAAMVDACRTVNLVMTRAKMSLFVLPDGFDKDDGTPLVRLHAGEPERTEMLVRSDNGSADIRIRPMWRQWAANVRVQFDADLITADSVVNLLDRAGRQVGIGEGRPFSRNSVGMGWGTFTVVQAAAADTAA
jgi:hypothetical protein